METAAKVMHLTWEFPPRIVGGLGVHVAGLARAQAESGLAVSVLTAGTRRRTMGGVHVIGGGRRPTPQGGPFLWQLERFSAELVRCALADPSLRADPPTLIHAHDWLVAGAALCLARIWRAPLVVTFHATELGRRGAAIRRDAYSAAVAGWEERLADAASLCLAPSEALAGEVRELAGRPVAVVPGGFDPEARVLPRRPHPGRLLVAARLVPEKGLDTLLAALSLLVRAGYDVSLDVAGEGPLLTDLALRRERLGLGQRVRLLGHLGRAELALRRARAALAVQPSRYEPFGLAALEAVAAGVPVLASQVGGLAEWGRGLVAFAPPGDAERWAEATARLLGERGELSPVTAEGRLMPLTWSSAARAVMQLYDRVLGAGKPWR